MCGETRVTGHATSRGPRPTGPSVDEAFREFVDANTAPDTITREKLVERILEAQALSDEHLKERHDALQGHIEAEEAQIEWHCRQIEVCDGAISATRLDRMVHATEFERRKSERPS